MYVHQFSLIPYLILTHIQFHVRIAVYFFCRYRRRITTDNSSFLLLQYSTIQYISYERTNCAKGRAHSKEYIKSRCSL